MYLTSITISFAGDNANNLANYIMYEDTANQCNSKLSIAVGYLGGMSSSERTTFQTSKDYVISTARARLEAWATSQGKTINYSNGSLSSYNTLLGISHNGSNNATIMIVLLTLVGLTAVGGCAYIQIKRNKQ